jgi:serine protease Do
MSLADDLMSFFSGHPAAVPAPPVRFTSEFFQAFPMYEFTATQRAIRKLVENDLLVFCGVVAGQPAITHSAYVSIQTPDRLIEARAYGTYQFLVEGWLSIRNAFADSVVMIEVTKGHENDLGSGFVLLFDNLIVTAKHCVEGMETTTVIRSDGTRIDIDPSEWQLSGSADVAFTMIEPWNAKPFKVGAPSILQPVLTLGYPPIPGFADPLLLAESAEVAARRIPDLTGSTGEVSGVGSAYLDSQDYWLLTARVKGGNSGGPVISKDGLVVGLISANAQLADHPDLFGYVTMVSATEILETIRAVGARSIELD